MDRTKRNTINYVGSEVSVAGQERFAVRVRVGYKVGSRLALENDNGHHDSNCILCLEFRIDNITRVFI